jgi:hypothetical protein
MGIDALMDYHVDFTTATREAVLEAISAVCDGQLNLVVVSVVRSDGPLPFSSGTGVSELRVPRVVRRLLARAAERRVWLSRPLGERPHGTNLVGQAARAVIASSLDREPSGGWLRWPRRKP